MAIERQTAAREPGIDGGPLMQIGEVAELLGLSLRSIRYYGEMQLAPPSARSEGGFRLYGAGDVARLRLIMEMKPLGFSLKQMRDLLAAQDQLAELGDASGSGQISSDLLDRVTTLHDAAQNRVAELVDQLKQARAFAIARAADVDRLRGSALTSRLGPGDPTPG